MELGIKDIGELAMAINVSALLSRSERIDCGEINRNPFELYAKQPIELDCGISVKISDIHQFHTYGGMLAGLPRKEQLGWHIDIATRAAERLFPDFDAVRTAIFPPAISSGTLIEKISPELAKRLGLGTDVTEQCVSWALLPKITTIALLQQSTSFDSVLAIWWQGEVGYPDANLLNQICKLSWVDHVVEIDP